MIHKLHIKEEEWWSICCTAPPLYDIDEDVDEPIGLCMHCRDNTVFEKQPV
mgnify:CR=1 FL=1|tara:strand:- start:3994 stop:4146 length:153 start_codon:yes stop_codon:yes gene_type:complete